MNRFLFLAIVGMTLIICISDIRFRRIPNWTLTPLGVLLLIYQGESVNFACLWRALTICVLYLGIYLVSRRSLGAGDVKLAFVLSAAAHSWRSLYLIHLFAWMSAGLSIPVGVVARRKLRNHTVAFAPYLAVPTLWHLLTSR